MPDWETQNFVSREVIHSIDKQIDLGSKEIEELIEMASRNERKRIRFCIHECSDNKVHEMFIVHPRGAYVRPHRHINKVESMLVLKGDVDYVVLDDTGSIEKIIPMGGIGSGKTFYNSLRESIYHTLLIRSEWLIFLEITKGPFNRNDTIFAEWAPKEGNELSVNKFLNKLENQIKNEPLHS